MSHSAFFIRVYLTTEDGTVLDQFKVLISDDSYPIASFSQNLAAQAIRETVEDYFEVEDLP